MRNKQVRYPTISPASTGEIISFVVPEALGSAEIDNYDIIAEIVTDGISMPG
jgi:hypothetical protein